jgi:hydrogenase maturation protease
MGDEGLGVHIARALQNEKLPEGVDVVDGGTAGFQLMEYLESYPVVIMIDATLDKNPVGTIRMIEPKFARDFPKAMSTHEIGLKDLVESLALMGKLPRVYLFVMTVQDIANLHVGLSQLVDEKLPEFKRLILNKVNELLPSVIA